MDNRSMKVTKSRIARCQSKNKWKMNQIENRALMAGGRYHAWNVKSTAHVVFNHRYRISHSLAHYLTSRARKWLMHFYSRLKADYLNIHSVVINFFPHKITLNYFSASIKLFYETIGVFIIILMKLSITTPCREGKKWHNLNIANIVNVRCKTCAVMYLFATEISALRVCMNAECTPRR